MANKKKKQTKSSRPAGHMRPAKKKLPTRKARAKKTTSSKRTLENRQSVNTVAFELEDLAVRSGGQSGDLQGLSDIAEADSESVDELLEEGNAFEAEVVKGVQDAGDTDEGEVITHEIPQDDVPKEYLEEEE